MVDLLEVAGQFLPNLSLEARQTLYNDLKRLSEGHSVALYFESGGEFRLQGDALANAPVLRFTDDGIEVSKGRVMVVSASCDISTENVRTAPVQITIAPMMRVSNWKKLLVDAGVGHAAVDSKLDALRQNKITNALFLPMGGKFDEDQVVLLDYIQYWPLERFEQEQPSLITSLNSPGHWLLALKLSMHFSRLWEDVSRSGSEVVEAA